MDGEDILKVKDLNLLRARIGMVFQKPTPFPMSIYDNVTFGLKLYERLPKSELDGRVEDALTRAAPGPKVKVQAGRVRPHHCRADNNSVFASPAASRRVRK